jgi:predicted enzyme related to lactoylglutathione lyase
VPFRIPVVGHPLRCLVTRIVSVDPIFAAADIRRAAEHYQRFGFEISYHDDSYAFAQRQGLDLHLDLTNSPAPGGALLYLRVEDADRLAAEWRAAGADVTEPKDYPWGQHEGSDTDPDGNTIRFGSPLRG